MTIERTTPTCSGQTSLPLVRHGKRGDAPIPQETLERVQTLESSRQLAGLSGKSFQPGFSGKPKSTSEPALKDNSVYKRGRHHTTAMPPTKTENKISKAAGKLSVVEAGKRSAAEAGKRSGEEVNTGQAGQTTTSAIQRAKRANFNHAQLANPKVQRINDDGFNATNADTPHDVNSDAAILKSTCGRFHGEPGSINDLACLQSTCGENPGEPGTVNSGTNDDATSNNDGNTTATRAIFQSGTETRAKRAKPRRAQYYGPSGPSSPKRNRQTRKFNESTTISTQRLRTHRTT